jgi:hypothetical protein
MDNEPRQIIRYGQYELGIAMFRNVHSNPRALATYYSSSRPRRSLRSRHRTCISVVTAGNPTQLPEMEPWD